MIILGCRSATARALGAMRTNIRGFASPIPATILIRDDEGAIWFWPVEPRLVVELRGKLS